MTPTTIDTGLCVNCIQKDLCTYRGSHPAPIVFCEEFDCADPESHWSGQPDTTVNDSGTADLTTGGLCANCGHLDTCVHPGKNSRITYCEDYS